MKPLLRSLFPAAVLVAAVGCSKQDTATAPAAAAQEPAATAATATPAGNNTTAAPAASTAPVAAPAAAAKQEARTIEITANDQMKFSVTRIEATPGETLQIKLVNVGSLPKEAMGHNWVLLKKDVKAQDFANAALTAKATEYIPANLKDQVVAHTKLLGPKQNDTITFTVPSEAGEYPFICSFPAHAIAGMKGVLVVK